MALKTRNLRARQAREKTNAAGAAHLTKYNKMPKLERLQELLAKTEREQEENRMTTHPFKDALIAEWDRRIVAVKANIADAEKGSPQRDRTNS